MIEYDSYLYNFYTVLGITSNLEMTKYTEGYTRLCAHFGYWISINFGWTQVPVDNKVYLHTLKPTFQILCSNYLAGTHGVAWVLNICFVPFPSKNSCEKHIS